MVILTLACVFLGVKSVSAWFAADPAPAVNPVFSPTATQPAAQFVSYSGSALSEASSNLFVPYPTPTLPPYPDEGSISIDADGRRFREQTVTLNAYYWMLLSWSANQLECQVYIDHSGQPTPAEIKYSCGGTVHGKWRSTPACMSESPTSCKGLYLHYGGRQVQEIDVLKVLPKPTVEITTPNCQPYFGCTQLAEVRFTAAEPLPEFDITFVHYRIDGVEYACPGEYCQVTLPITGERSQLIEVWASSTLGDESYPQTFRVRNVLVDGLYQFELLGEQWAHLAPSCALEWQRLPPLETATLTWLESPPTPEYLTSANRFALLAGQLIWNGQVDASSCADGGLLANRAASPCGETLAAALVLSMQNQYDPAIFIASNQVGIPPKLIKAVIGQESQFWPEPDVESEYGLGHVSDHGIDMLLTWNLPYYLDICRETLDSDACAHGYDSLSDSEKAMLRGASLAAVGTPAEITLIAEMLKASCAQVTQLSENILDSAPGEHISYPHLWALALATYHSGVGCVAHALEETFDDEEDLIWSEIATRMEGACESAEQYVERVFYLGR